MQTGALNTPVKRFADIILWPDYLANCHTTHTDTRCGTSSVTRYNEHPSTSAERCEDGVRGVCVCVLSLIHSRGLIKDRAADTSPTNHRGSFALRFNLLTGDSGIGKVQISAERPIMSVQVRWITRRARSEAEPGFKFPCGPQSETVAGEPGDY